ncbi:MAG: transposase [bacterium]
MQFHRQSIRLPDYDYSDFGYYFVTICAQNMAYDFGIIIDNKIKLTKIGEIAGQYWLKIPEHFKKIKLDKFVVMPNHLHGIVVIECRGAPWRAPTKTKFGPLKPKSLSLIMNHFKGSVKRWSNKNSFEYFQWQRNYYERIIRNSQELNRTRLYIQNNPINWELDRNNPENFKL